MSSSPIEYLTYDSDNRDPVEMSVGPVDLRETTRVEESGGLQTPEYRTEEGFSYSSRVGPEPVEIEVRATVGGQKLDELRGLRERSRPFPTTIGKMTMPRSTLADLRTTGEGQTPGVYEVRVSVREVITGSSEFNAMQVRVNGEPHSSSADNIEALVIESEEEPESDEDDTFLQPTIDKLKNTIGGLF